MSVDRARYVEDWDDQWGMIRWRGAVASAIRGKRGQAFLQELLEALDALPEEKLITGALVAENGAVCALGALGQRRGLDMGNIDPHDYGCVASLFGQSEALIREIEYENDDGMFFWRPGGDTVLEEERFRSMRCWVVSRIKDETLTVEKGS